MNLWPFSLARYTFPNLPLPSGLPMSKSDNCHRRSLPPLPLDRGTMAVAVEAAAPAAAA